MSFQIGIVGLPNVGKSTLFSAITKSAVDCANFPFCTIDPNVGVVEVPDERLDQLAAVSKSKKIVHTTVEFVDIAGLVKGASEGQGLGNKFLANIRECDAIAQVLRAFEDADVIHVEGTVEPDRDAETISMELALADLDLVEKRLDTAKKQLKAGRTKELETLIAALERAKEALAEGTSLRDLDWTADELKELKQLQPLTLKPMIYVLNVSETQLQDGSWKGRIGHSGPLALLPVDPNNRITEQPNNPSLVPICVKMEAELASLPEEDRAEYLASVGQTESGLDRLIKAGYDALGLITFLTSGEKESRAWTVVKGSAAPVAAGKIHSDFEKAFIRAEVCRWQDFVAYGGEVGCREKGLLRIEGKDYVVQDGDVCNFRVGV
jgi:ribosome-binding ATPase